MGCSSAPAGMKKKTFLDNNLGRRGLDNVNDDALIGSGLLRSNADQKTIAVITCIILSTNWQISVSNCSVAG